VKFTNSDEYRLEPMSGFVEPDASTPLKITHLNGALKEEVLFILFAEAGEATDAQAPFCDYKQGKFVFFLELFD
jgi:hypothetical protein